jgi:hypothetical protein
MMNVSALAYRGICCMATRISEMHSLQYRLVSIFFYLPFSTVVPPLMVHNALQIEKIFQYNFPCLEILISWPLVALATTRTIFRIMFIMDCTGNTTFNHLWISQRNSRSVIAALMSLVWSGHYSYFSICDIISWQMKCINQILTEDGMATTKWNSTFLYSHLYHLMKVANVQPYLRGSCQS